MSYSRPVKGVHKTHAKKIKHKQTHSKFTYIKLKLGSSPFGNFTFKSDIMWEN